MKCPYMPFYVADYMQDTMHLSCLEHGAYMLMIMHYWTKGNVPDNDIILARITKLTIEQWNEVKPILSEFFQEGWKHKRIDEELAKRAELSNKRKLAAMQMHSKCSASDPSTLTIHKQVHIKEEEDNISVDFEELWRAYPRRGGSNPKALAERAFRGAIAKGANPRDIIAAALRYAEGIRGDGKERTPFVAQTATWLNQVRWKDDYVPEQQSGNSKSVVAAADRLVERVKGFINDAAPPVRPLLTLASG